LEATKDDILSGDEVLFSQVDSSGQVVQKTKSFLDDALGQIKAFSNGIANSIKSIDAKPDEFEVTFAVKFSANAGVIISSVSSEASISVKLKWKK
jgi:hypothetical protein